MTENNTKKVLVTGAAGFIGFHVIQRFLKEGYEVVGLDSINDYYSVQLKMDRLAELGINKNSEEWKVPIRSDRHKFGFVRAQLEDQEYLNQLFRKEHFDLVVHLAAQAGVRYSLEHPKKYIDSNIIGFFNILEACKSFSVEHLVYASSSSIYGDRDDPPFREGDRTDTPISLYAATKKSGELMAYTYSHLYGIKTTALRFFTVYGPWGRPDMAISLFTENINKGKPIKVFNRGELSRDFTYIDDIVEGVLRITRIPPNETTPPFRVFNIGRNEPVPLMDFIRAIEKALGKKADLELIPMQPGDVHTTWADVTQLKRVVNYEPKVDVEEGISRFAEWWKSYTKNS